MTTQDLILAIDNGTQSLKALIFDTAGQLLAKEAVTFVPYYSEGSGRGLSGDLAASQHR
jgi:sugar (pentulose or hexulose) kinase